MFPGLILSATSFGGVKSTWARPARWPGETAPASLIRLSAEIEPLASIVADIVQAMKAI